MSRQEPQTIRVGKDVTVSLISLVEAHPRLWSVHVTQLSDEQVKKVTGLSREDAMTALRHIHLSMPYWSSPDHLKERVKGMEITGSHAHFRLWPRKKKICSLGNGRHGG